MTYRLGKASERNLAGVHPTLADAVRLAIGYTEQDFCILKNGGVRSAATARANAAKGVGVANSLHILQPDGFGHAVDLVAYQGGPVWGQTSSEIRRLYDPIRAAMYRACDELGLLIQNGADWDNDAIVGERGEWDHPHFQMPQWPHTKEAARLAAIERAK
jgi:hypothetical protein